MKRTRRDWILWGALGCALVSTAHAEYTLATAAHFNEYVALAVPGALDLYVVRALQQRRDVFVAVLAMVAANVASHLIAGGVLAVGWQVIAAVGAVAPLIVWRVYSLKYTRNRQELLWGAEAGAVSAPALGDEAPGHDHYDRCGCRWWRLWSECTAPDPSAPAPDHVPAWVPGYHIDGCDGQHEGDSWLNCAKRAPDHVPADWMEDEYPETHPSALHSRTSAVPYLAPVPDLPPEYETGAVHSESPLTASDWDYLTSAQKYVDDHDKPSVRGLRREIGIGQERAERLLTHLGVIL